MQKKRAVDIMLRSLFFDIFIFIIFLMYYFYDIIIDTYLNNIYLGGFNYVIMARFRSKWQERYS